MKELSSERFLLFLCRDQPKKDSKAMKRVKEANPDFECHNVKVCLTFDYEYLSTPHCVIRFTRTPQKVEIMDLSENGTAVSAKPVASIETSAMSADNPFVRIEALKWHNLQQLSVIYLGDPEGMDYGEYFQAPTFTLQITAEPMKRTTKDAARRAKGKHARSAAVSAAPVSAAASAPAAPTSSASAPAAATYAEAAARAVSVSTSTTKPAAAFPSKEAQDEEDAAAAAAYAADLSASSAAASAPAAPTSSASAPIAATFAAVAARSVKSKPAAAFPSAAASSFPPRPSRLDVKAEVMAAHRLYGDFDDDAIDSLAPPPPKRLRQTEPQMSAAADFPPQVEPEPLLTSAELGLSDEEIAQAAAAAKKACEAVLRQMFPNPPKPAKEKAPRQPRTALSKAEAAQQRWVAMHMGTYRPRLSKAERLKKKIEKEREEQALWVAAVPSDEPQGRWRLPQR